MDQRLAEVAKALDELWDTATTALPRKEYEERHSDLVAQVQRQLDELKAAANEAAGERRQLRRNVTIGLALLPVVVTILIVISEHLLK